MTLEISEKTTAVLASIETMPAIDETPRCGVKGDTAPAKPAEPASHTPHVHTVRGQLPIDRTYRFDRRLEPRAATDGWALVTCRNAFCTLLGGTVELADISAQGVGVVSDHQIPEGEVVEVRLAPFRVRGRLGIVVRNQRIADAPVPLHLADDRENQPDADVDMQPEPRYRIGISFRTNRAAA